MKETKTTIPISSTPKPISEFGLKPGKYRPSAVKVAGFDPLDANHAASTGGVASRPRQDVQTRKRKHWNERQPNDTAHANDRDGNGLRDREHAAGHLAGTSLPIGGKNTRAVITGHSNLKGATLFTRLGELEDGDPFYIKVMGNTLAYRVTSKRIVSPTDTKSLRVHKGKDEVTLLTCTGQGNTLRLLVTGERNSMPDQAPLPGDATGDVKKAAFVSGVTVTGILAVGFSLCRSRRAVGHHIGLPQTHDSDNLR